MHNTIVVYAVRMEWNLAELRCLVAAVETGTFTDAPRRSRRIIYAWIG